MTEKPLESLRSRRRLLQGIGTVGLGLLSGCSDRVGSTTPGATNTGTKTPGRPPDSTATETPAKTPEEYDRVVDMVEAGADPKGAESVTPILEEVADDDTLLSFPPGTYLFGSLWRFRGYSNLGIVGDRATLVPTEDLQHWLIAQDVADFTLAGFTLDHRGEGVGPQVQVHATGGRSVVHDLTIRGFHDSDIIPVIPNVESEDAALLVERLRIPDGTQGVPAVFVDPRSVGKLSFVDCYLEGCAQGIYASPHSGPFYALGGTYVNNNKGAIRVGAGTHGAHIDGVHVRIDEPDVDRWTNRKNLRGLWLREGANTFVTGCDIELLDLSGIGSDGAIYLDDTMGPATIRNTRIRVDADTYAVRAQQPSDNADSLQGDQPLPDEYGLTCENLEITGRAAGLDAIRVMGRDNSTLRNVVVDQPRGDRRGLVVGGNATGCTVEGGSLVTGHYPVVVEGRREQFTGESCPVRLEAVERIEAANLDDAGTKLAALDGNAYCVHGVGTLDTAEIVVAVSGVRNKTLYGKRMTTAAYERAYENWI